MKKKCEDDDGCGMRYELKAKMRQDLMPDVMTRLKAEGAGLLATCHTRPHTLTLSDCSPFSVGQNKPTKRYRNKISVVMYLPLIESSIFLTAALTPHLRPPLQPPTPPPPPTASIHLHFFLAPPRLLPPSFPLAVLRHVGLGLVSPRLITRPSSTSTKLNTNQEPAAKCHYSTLFSAVS